MNTEVLRNYIERANEKGLFNWLPDKYCLHLLYWSRLGERLNLRSPQTFNEKLQWLKLYNRKPEYTKMVDKYGAKQYVAERIGGEYVIPTLGVWDRFEDIDFDALPDQFVLKCTHDSGGLEVVRDKTKLDKDAVKAKIDRSLKKNYYFHGREWPYKDVLPRILAEVYMQDGDKINLPVYKFMNFSGEPRIIQVIQNDKTDAETIDYFDTDWNLLDLKQNFPNSAKLLERPRRLSEMLEISRNLSKGIPNVRVDLYEIDGRIYFSEFTFFSDSGFAPFYPPEWNEIMGSWIQLPMSEYDKSDNNNPRR